jgi:hypothetical protein
MRSSVTGIKASRPASGVLDDSIMGDRMSAFVSI